MTVAGPGVFPGIGERRLDPGESQPCAWCSFCEPVAARPDSLDVWLGPAFHRPGSQTRHLVLCARRSGQHAVAISRLPFHSSPVAHSAERLARAASRVSHRSFRLHTQRGACTRDVSRPLPTQFELNTRQDGRHSQQIGDLNSRVRLRTPQVARNTSWSAATRHRLACIHNRSAPR